MKKLTREELEKEKTLCLEKIRFLLSNSKRTPNDMAKLQMELLDFELKLQEMNKNT